MPSPAPLSVREATPDDNPGLLALTLATPMQADISLQIERDPDFFALSRARGTPRVLVATAGDRIVGCAASVRRPATLADGKPAEIGVIADLKVHPDWRRQGVAQALLEAISEHEATEPPAVFVAATAAGNKAVDGVALRLGPSWSLTQLGELCSYQLFPVLWPASPPDGVVLRSAQDTDRDALVDLLHRFHARYVLAPPFADGGFDELLSRSPGMDLSSYRIAVREGEIVAACAAWEPATLKRTRAVAMPAYLRLVAALTRVLPIPGLPPVGGLLRFRYLRHPACEEGHRDALRALIREALVETRRAGDHFLLFTCAVGDSLVDVVSGWPKTVYRYRLVAGINRPEAQASLEALRGRLCYDDAALA